jgi:hypothetical protein
MIREEDMRKRWFLQQHHVAHRVLSRFPFFLLLVIGYSLIYPFVLFQPLLTQLCITPYVCLMALFSGNVHLLSRHLTRIQAVVLLQGERLWGVHVYHHLLQWLFTEPV